MGTGANKRLDAVMNIGIGTTLVAGSFRPNGSSAVSASNNKGDRNGNAWSVARTSEGLYTITFADSFADLISFVATPHVADTGRWTTQWGDFDASARTLQLRTFGPKAGTGYIPLDITTAKIIAGDVIGNTTEGLFPDGNTAPSLQRVNSATDKALRVIWASSSSVEIQFAPIVYPDDLDDASAVTVCLRAAMGGATDTPTIAVGYFEGVGDTNAGGNTGAVTGTTVAEYTASIAAGDVGAAPKAANITLTPGAHTTDALHLYGAHVEYTSLKGGGLADMSSDADNRVDFMALFRNTSITGGNR